MRELGIRGLPGPTKRTANLVNAAIEEDLVQRYFVAQGHNELWLTDIERHEALLNREEVQDPLLQPVAAGW
jgi:hypothetical protein